MFAALLIGANNVQPVEHPADVVGVDLDITALATLVGSMRPESALSKPAKHPLVKSRAKKARKIQTWKLSRLAPCSCPLRA